MEEKPIRIEINGNVLNPGEIMTLRQALFSFYIDLKKGLGNDYHGRFMTEAYRRHLRRIEKYLIQG